MDDGTRHGDLPDGLERARTTDEFTASTVPAGLLRTHRIATGVWGRLRVRAGRLRFVWEGDDAPPPVDLGPGDSLVVPPDRPHRVEPDTDVRFVIEFHRPPDPT
ncbi:MAG: DUF1971 domain-containing protein [Acidimicrobiales bacterium]|nr:DUF1971 domain-containing protein [Acidimicrobiales bacterium]